MTTDTALTLTLADMIRKEREAPIGEHVGLARARTTWMEQTIPERWRQLTILGAACALLAKEERADFSRR